MTHPVPIRPATAIPAPPQPVSLAQAFWFICALAGLVATTLLPSLLH